MMHCSTYNPQSEEAFVSGKIILAAGIALISLFLLSRSSAGEGGKRATTLAERTEGMKLETATFAAGCFWHVEDTFRTVEGVVSTEVGFEGGKTDHPTYPDVCTDRTGHAEVVKIQYDPSRISYRKLLEAFFQLHDPTTVDRQGPDVGTQYRSVIFYASPEQKEQAYAFKSDLEKSGKYGRPIATGIVPASTFWRAEEYHQQYYEKERGETR
jgi:peptide-methionine (S)-S-oxide reductase